MTAPAPRSDDEIRADLTELDEPHLTLSKAETYDRLLNDVEPLLDRARAAEARVAEVEAERDAARYEYEVIRTDHGRIIGERGRAERAEARAVKAERAVKRVEALCADAVQYQYGEEESIAVSEIRDALAEPVADTTEDGGR